jgi:glycerophosphoryl diester phosphodiesterase
VALGFPFDQTAIVAHRGAHCCGNSENSLLAVAHAIELGAAGIEVDVCNLRDGELLLSHDPYIPIDGHLVPLPSLTLRDLTQLTGGVELPLARDALEVIRSSDAFLCLDWKGFGGEGRAVRLVAEMGLSERTIVSSSRSDALARMKDERPDVATGLSVPDLAGGARTAIGEHADEVLRRMDAAGADAVMLERTLASAAVLGPVRRRGAGVFFWTAKDAETVAALAGLSPDGVMSDALDGHHERARRAVPGGPVYAEALPTLSGPTGCGAGPSRSRAVTILRARPAM